MTAVILSQFIGLPDPRLQGSSNPGVSNVLRSGQKKLALAVLIGDSFKAILPLLLAKNLGIEVSALSWLAAFACLGHMFPIFFQFQGGRGVATAWGGLLVVSWPIALLGALIWLTIFALSQYASLASIGAALGVLGVSLWLLPSGTHSAIGVMVLFLICRHYPNLRRLWRGIELGAIENK